MGASQSEPLHWWLPGSFGTCSVRSDRRPPTRLFRGLRLGAAHRRTWQPHASTHHGITSNRSSRYQPPAHWAGWLIGPILYWELRHEPFITDLGGGTAPCSTKRLYTSFVFILLLGATSCATCGKNVRISSVTLQRFEIR